ncbi:MOSC domain-containing protein [Salinisphaera aquimarina]|uniref:MOSC domain-containing protein n=1 Tax=Salinisphaera aquimarina TaxID=2094031 RepID=A0ABV7EPD1_9GAMM
MASLQRILTAPTRGASMVDAGAIEAIPGRGLAGDRYWVGTGTFSGRPGVFAGARELSMIDVAAIALCNERLALDAGAQLDAADLRRNLVVAGLELPALRQRLIRVGPVTLEIVSSCPPCGYLSRLLGVDARQALRGIGGVRARIVDAGWLQVGDAIIEVGGGQR